MFQTTNQLCIHLQLEHPKAGIKSVLLGMIAFTGLVQ
jgi:hypothetical protein